MLYLGSLFGLEPPHILGQLIIESLDKNHNPLFFNGGLMEPILDFLGILIQVLGVGHLICNKKTQVLMHTHF